MSLRSWKADPNLTRESHNWVFVSAYAQEWGATITFSCKNPGCNTTCSFPFMVKDQPFQSTGICFDTQKAVQLTDKEGRQ